MEKFGNLEVLPAASQFDLLAKPTAEIIGKFAGLEIGVAEIDSQFSDTAAFCEHYGVNPNETVNCVVVKANRAEKIWFAACVIFATTRADVNGLVRRHLGARKVSFAPMDEAVLQTKMEYGGITPVGLPNDWPILIDAAVAASNRVLLGSGIRKSKLIVPGKFLANLPNAVVLEGLGVEKPLT